MIIVVKNITEEIRNANPVTLFALAFFAGVTLGMTVLALPVIVPAWVFVYHAILVPIFHVIRMV